MTRILGIETSCDETSAAVLEGTGDDVTQKSLVILSQDVHRVFGARASDEHRAGGESGNRRSGHYAR